MGLFFTMGRDQDVLDVAGVTNVVQRDECFLSSVDLNDATCSRSSVTRSLAKDTYVSEDGTLEIFIRMRSQRRCRHITQTSRRIKM